MTADLKPRAAAIDAVRVFGIGAVIFSHTFTGQLTHQFVYAWHVPLFFFLTGYLWSRGRSTGAELVKRGMSLGLPYAGWFVIVTGLFILDASRTGPVDLGFLQRPALGGSNAQGPYGTFWFVSALFFTAVLYRAIERLPRLAVWAIALAGLIVGYLFGGWLAATPLAVGSTLPCMFFLVVGTAARELENRITRPALTGIALVVIPLIVIGVTHPEPIDIKQGIYGAPTLGVVLACAISYGLVLVAKTVRFSRSAATAVTELAVVGIAVVLFHPYVLYYTRVHGVPAEGMFALAVVVPWAVALLLHRTPLSVVLIGARRRLLTPVAVTSGRDVSRRGQHGVNR